MASADASLEFTGAQREMVTRLALGMKIVAGVLFLLAGINLVGGIMTLLTGSLSGLLAIIEGLVTALLGLIMLSSSADVRFMVQTPYTSIHLGNAFQNLQVFFKTQLLLALFLIVVTVARLFVG